MKTNTTETYACSISDLPARSQQKGMYDSSLVNFIGQSKATFDGSPVYAFKICGAVTVKVYTGNLLRLDCVDAIVCAINAKLKGGLAAAVAKAAGPSYQQDLSKTAMYSLILINGLMDVTKHSLHTCVKTKDIEKKVSNDVHYLIWVGHNPTVVLKHGINATKL